MAHVLPGAAPMDDGRVVALIGAIAFAATGCGDGGGSLGELGNGRFQYGCLRQSDATCSDETVITYDDDYLPSRVAVGSEMSIAYNGERPEDDGRELSVRVVSASPEMAEPLDDDPGFTVLRAGEAAFLALGSNGQVADFVHVDARAVAELEVSDSIGELDTLDLEPEQAATLRVLPRDEGSAALGGGLSYAWSSSDDAVARVTAAEWTREAQVVAVGPGSAVVRVEAGGVVAEVTVTVEVAP